MPKKNNKTKKGNLNQKYIGIGLVAIVLLATFLYFIYLAENKKSKPTSVTAPSQTSDQVYSYKKVTYNGWGILKNIEGNLLTIEGSKVANSDGTINKENLGKLASPVENKYVLSSQAIIVKSEGDGKVISLSDVKIGDRLGFKTSQEVDKITRYEVVTDVVIMLPLPEKFPVTPVPSGVKAKK